RRDGQIDGHICRGARTNRLALFGLTKDLKSQKYARFLASMDMDEIAGQQAWWTQILKFAFTNSQSQPR
ncbi:hypothetical protein X801_09896, partial [Opisthorchis viverrini]